MSIEMVESEEDQEESWDDAYANKRTNLCSCRTRNAVSSKLGQRVFGLEKDRPKPGMDGKRRRVRDIGGRERVPWGLPDEGWRTSSRPTFPSLAPLLLLSTPEGTLLNKILAQVPPRVTLGVSAVWWTACNKIS
uniref:Uncharacterized protein n=1 Tax=Vespula pensylvanica TaxID=30213 RepID=A0A834U456_VESPE|nr:hypothetical protein H0235_012299 [Vespula pensylvanica]